MSTPVQISYATPKPDKGGGKDGGKGKGGKDGGKGKGKTNGYDPYGGGGGGGGGFGGPPAASGPSENLYMKGLPPETTDDMLRGVFGQYGTVQSTKVLPSSEGKSGAA